MTQTTWGKPFLSGMLASMILLTVFFLVAGFVSDLAYAKAQFAQYWYFILLLAFGFGIQVGLYAYLKTLIQNASGTGKVLGVTGTTSTISMISCCAHYLTNLLPLLGIAGIVTFIAAYQSELFSLGIFFNGVGIVYVLYKILQFKKRV